MNSKIIASGAVLLIAAFAVAGCTSGNSAPSGQALENQQQKQDSTSLVNDQPIPHFNYSQIRQTLIDAETISSDGTQTTSFFFQMGDQDPVFTCPSLGMPVANTAQLSNPDQVINDTGSSSPTGGAALTVGQMDPDGIYAPSASTGTYVICVNSSGQKYLEYWEGDVMTVTSGATWDSATHSLKVMGAPTAVIHTSASTKK
jgi:hypothetical protein